MRPGKIVTLLALLLTFTACEDIFFEKVPSNSPEGNFESIWSTFDERYAVFDERNVDWEAMYDVYRLQVTGSTTDDQLYQIITSMLDTLDDGHVSLMAPGRQFWNAHTTFRTQEGSLLFNLFIVLEDYLNGRYTRLDDQVFYGMYEGDIGYIFINHLQAKIPIDEIMSSLSGAKAVVIDVRHNGGGDFTNAEPFAARFADQRRLAFSGQPKDGPGPDDFGVVTDYFLEPKGQTFEGPIAVITSRYTISAGENLVMYLNILPNVTVLGEPTAGAMGERIEKEMPNGWIYSITGQLVKAADGISYEGPGLPVDIAFVNTQEDVDNRIDSLFLTAVSHLRDQL